MRSINKIARRSDLAATLPRPRFRVMYLRYMLLETRTDATTTIASFASEIATLSLPARRRVDSGRRVIRVQSVAARTFKFGRSVYDRRRRRA